MVLPVGVGDRHSACSIASINLALTGELTDDIPGCMSDVIGKWIITVQDAMPSKMRNSEAWKSMLPMAAGTGKAKQLERRRLSLIKKWYVANAIKLDTSLSKTSAIRWASDEDSLGLADEIDSIILVSDKGKAACWKMVNPPKLLKQLIQLGQPKPRKISARKTNSKHKHKRRKDHMSHRMIGSVCITDINSLRKAVIKNEKLKWVEGATEYNYHGAHNKRPCVHKIQYVGEWSEHYDIGVVQSEDGKGYRLEWESDGYPISNIIGNAGCKLHTDYAKEVARDWAAKNGFTVAETVDKEGSIVLTMEN